MLVIRGYMKRFLYQIGECRFLGYIPLAGSWVIFHGQGGIGVGSCSGLNNEGEGEVYRQSGGTSPFAFAPLYLAPLYFAP